MPSIFSVSYKLNTLQSNSIADVWILWHYWQQQFCSTLTYVQHIKPDKMTAILNKIITCHSHNSRKLFFSLFVKGKRTEQINLLYFMKVPLSPKWYLSVESTPGKKHCFASFTNIILVTNKFPTSSMMKYGWNNFFLSRKEENNTSSRFVGY